MEAQEHPESPSLRSWGPLSYLHALWNALPPPAAAPTASSKAEARLLLRATLEGRLADLRTGIADLRSRAGEYTAKHFQADFGTLATAEYALDEVELALDEKAPTEAQYHHARGVMLTVQRDLDGISQRLARHTLNWELGLSAYASLVLIVAALLSDWLYVHPARPAHGAPVLDPQTWYVLRLALLTACGGLLGSASDLLRILSHVLPNRSLDPRRIVLYFLFPLSGASLAGAFYVLVQAGTGFAALGTGKPMTTVAAVFSLGFLIGFLPSTVVYRINQIVKAFFGTDEVKAPQVTPPQTVRISQTRIKVSAAVVSSTTTRIASVTARLQLQGETHSSAGVASVPLRRGTESTWVGELSVPQDQATGGGTGATGPRGVLVIEARDETGNIGRSDPVSLPPLLKDDTPDNGTGGSGSSPKPPPMGTE